MQAPRAAKKASSSSRACSTASDSSSHSRIDRTRLMSATAARATPTGGMPVRWAPSPARLPAPDCNALDLFGEGDRDAGEQCSLVVVPRPVN